MCLRSLGRARRPKRYVNRAPNTQFWIYTLPGTLLSSVPYRSSRYMASKAGSGGGVGEGGGQEKPPLGGRGACRATAPSIAPPVAKKTKANAKAAAADGLNGEPAAAVAAEEEDEEPSERDNAKGGGGGGADVWGMGVDDGEWIRRATKDYVAFGKGVVVGLVAEQHEFEVRPTQV